MHLRDYQVDGIRAVNTDFDAGYTDVLGVAATGAGKTNMFLCAGMGWLDSDPAARLLIIAHRRELIDQPLERIRSIDPEWLMRGSMLRPRVGAVMAERNDYDRQLVVATVQTLASEKRLKQLLSAGPITHLIIDECHHATAQSYLTVLEGLRAANPELRHLGVTATPLRADGDGLAKVYQKDSFKITIADLVRQGYLTMPRWLGIETGISLKGVQSSGGDFVQRQLADRFDTPEARRIIVEAYTRFAAGRQAIAFTASVAGAEELARAFRVAGISADFVSGETPKDQRASILQRYRAGQIQILCNCQVLTEGFDAPSTSCVLMCRPTRSDSLYVQCMGRGLRPAMGRAQPGEDCIILDFMPVEKRNIVMAGDVLGIPKDQAEALRKLAEEEDADEGLAQLGFTFDGERFDYGGTPLEIVARQLDYLNASPFTWYRHDGWMTLGLGPGHDGNERLMAVPPGGPPWLLYGLVRPEKSRDPWRFKVLLRSNSLDDIAEHAERVATFWANPALASKDRAWQQRPVSDGQKKYLRRLSSGEVKAAQMTTMNMGEAAALISHYQAVRELSGLQEVAA